MKLVTIIIATLLCTPALAIDFSASILQLDGKPFTDKDGKPVEYTLGGVSEQALMAPYQDERDAVVKDPNKLDEFNKEVARRFSLAQRIHNAKGDVDLDPDTRAYLRKLIGKSWGMINPTVMGEAWQMIDPASVPK